MNGVEHAWLKSTLEKMTRNRSTLLPELRPGVKLNTKVVRSHRLP